MPKNKIITPSDLRKYRTEIPNLYDDSELDPYEFRLLAHYVRRGECYESVRTTSAHCKMSLGKVVDARKSLEEKGFIRTYPATEEHSTIVIEVVDVWEKNFSRYSKRSHDEHDVQDMNTGVHLVNGECSPGEPKKEPNKEITQEEDFTPTATLLSPHKLMFEALVSVTGIDPKLNGGRIGKVAKQLIKSGYPDTLIRDSYSPGGWWYLADWRGQKNQPPTLAQITETIGLVGRPYTPVLSNGKRSNFERNVLANQQLMESIYEP